MGCVLFDLLKLGNCSQTATILLLHPMQLFYIVLSIEAIELKSKEEHQRHIAALVLLIAFMQLYILLVRIAPNTPYLVYINM